MAEKTVANSAGWRADWMAALSAGTWAPKKAARTVGQRAVSWEHHWAAHSVAKTAASLVARLDQQLVAKKVGPKADLTAESKAAN